MNPKFSCSYYDDEQMPLLRATPFGTQFDDVVKNGFRVDPIEFLVYSAFDEQKDHPGWRTFKELKRTAAASIDRFRNYFDIGGDTVMARFKGANQVPNDITEDAGVAGSLVLMNEVCGLHEADWQRIPWGVRKSLDYRIASTGQAFVEVEAKGTIVAGDKKEIYAHKAGIVSKKTEQRELSGRSDLLVGVIAAYPFETAELAHCYLVDPPPEDLGVDPWKYKLLARLYFYWRNLRWLAGPVLAGDLLNRIKIIDRVTDFRRLAKKELTGGRQELAGTSDSVDRPRTRTWLGANVVGDMFPIGPREYCYVGFDTAVFDTVRRQNFEEILTFRAKSQVSDKEGLSVEAFLLNDDLQRYGMISQGNTKEKQGTGVRKMLHGRSCAMPSGKVVGFFS